MKSRTACQGQLSSPQCGCWQVPVDPKDQEKTAFSPGPGMGLFQFTRMPFGLCGAPSTFQRLMNVVMRGLPFVTTYIDDVLIHSANKELHKSHLEQAFQRLREAGLTLRGSKCQIGMAQVTYLGHTFSTERMSPDSSKVEVVVNWPRQRMKQNCSDSLDLLHTTTSTSTSLLTLQLHYTS